MRLFKQFASAFDWRPRSDLRGDARADIVGQTRGPRGQTLKPADSEAPWVGRLPKFSASLERGGHGLEDFERWSHGFHDYVQWAKLEELGPEADPERNLVHPDYSGFRERLRRFAAEDEGDSGRSAPLPLRFWRERETGQIGVVQSWKGNAAHILTTFDPGGRKLGTFIQDPFESYFRANHDDRLPPDFWRRWGPGA